MTSVPDPQLADSIGNWLVFGSGLALAIWRRRKQNETLAHDIDDSLAKQVAMLQKQVNEIKSSLVLIQELVASHSSMMREGNALAGVLSSKLEELDQTVLKGETLVAQFNSYLERAKAGTLIEKPIVGSGGLTAIKKEET